MLSIRMRNFTAMVLFVLFWLFIASVIFMFWWPLLKYSAHYWFG